jgi:hypothetical protein
MQGVIETDDGAVILVDSQVYGRAYPAGRRQIVVTSTHVSSDERYAWLNDVVCVAVGEVRTLDSGETLLVIDVAELIWEPIAEHGTLLRACTSCGDHEPPARMA